MRWTNYGDEIMRRISKSVASWLSIESERGVTAIEYGLIASLIALAIIAAVTLVGTNLGEHVHRYRRANAVAVPAS